MNSKLSDVLKQGTRKVFDVLSFGRTKANRAVSLKTGESFEEAIEIKGIGTRGELTASEYDWIIARYGEMHFAWRLAGHSLMVQGETFCERIRIELRNGENTVIFFDVTDFIRSSKVPNSQLLVDERAFRRLMIYTPIAAIIAAFFMENKNLLKLTWMLVAPVLVLSIAYRESLSPRLKKFFTTSEDWNVKDTPRNRFAYKLSQERFMGIAILFFALLLILSLFD